MDDPTGDGVAFWTLPRFSGENRYGREFLGWASFVLLNGGAMITAVAYWMNVHFIILMGYVLTLTSAVVFAVLMWPRVKPLGGYSASQDENR